MSARRRASHMEPYPQAGGRPLKVPVKNVGEQMLGYGEMPDTQDMAPNWTSTMDHEQTSMSVNAIFQERKCKPQLFPFSDEAAPQKSISTGLSASSSESSSGSSALATASAAPVTEVIDWPSGRMPPFMDTVKSGSSSTTLQGPHTMSYPDLVKTVTLQGHVSGELSNNERYILARMHIFCNKELEVLNAEGVALRNKVLELQCRVRLLEGVIIGLGGQPPDYENAMIVM
ncbi:hypothetical protein FISHEDRAFT_78687 [Fistulina hepatica ATCC 64428]|uniref:Uncharacterized protein n=1 Tax=Fistulina hepatica ATCC 64428 TaxID=1128425 RepID=A0A0D7A191_9AGAR|nr:hypothetical protein FISHEDRAFT_78687 [Fistulina hepatica ATCC 64428]